MTALYLKAIHIIFIVTWFAGLFYMPRLFVYWIESHDKPEPARSILIAQIRQMASRLWYAITWPSAVITACLGASLLINEPSWLQHGFMHIKLILVFFLYLYHVSLHMIFKQLSRGVVKYTSGQMRMWNEVATLFLISIVFLIVVKNALSMLWGLAGLLAITMAIMTGIRLYKKYRKE
ncbi:MAG TPA: CopD family protein [Ohtaekwangia sp.]|nr:CopD family protein [Ohtaekwangia sp.]